MNDALLINLCNLTIRVLFNIVRMKKGFIYLKQIGIFYQQKRVNNIKKI